MANDFSRMPISLTAAMGSTYQNSSPPNNLSIYPRTIYWFNPASVGDTFVITDAGGTNVIFTGRCEVTNQSQYFPVPVGVKWPDFKLTTLASGTLYIYYTT